MKYPYREAEGPPTQRDYAWYHRNALRAIEDGEPSEGVKGLFAFHKHPHADLIIATTDYMHAFYNLVTDFLDASRPTQNSYDTHLGNI